MFERKLTEALEKLEKACAEGDDDWLQYYLLALKIINERRGKGEEAGPRDVRENRRGHLDSCRAGGVT